MSGPRQFIKNAVALVMAAACGTATGIGACRAVEWYNRGEWRPAADDPALHGRFKTRLAWSRNESEKASFGFGD